SRIPRVKKASRRTVMNWIPEIAGQLPRLSSVRTGGISRRNRLNARLAESVIGSRPAATLLLASRIDATDVVTGDGSDSGIEGSGRRLRTVSSARRSVN